MTTMKPTRFPNTLTFCYQYAAIVAALMCIAAGKVHVEASRDKILSYSLEREGFLSDKARKDLTSGLTTKVVLLAKLVELPNKSINEQLITIASRYDLWEEKFYLSTEDDGKIIFQSQSDLEKALEAPGPFKWLPLSALKQGGQYKIEVVESLNPLSQEKFEALQKWVTRQKLSLRGSGISNDPANSAVMPETSFSALFYSLWKRASKGEVLTGELRREAVSEVFTLESLVRVGEKGRAH